jgi:hypothetical protein
VCRKVRKKRDVLDVVQDLVRKVLLGDRDLASVRRQARDLDGCTRLVAELYVIHEVVEAL